MLEISERVGKYENMGVKQKHVFIEAIRIVACFLVIVNHTTTVYLHTDMWANMMPPRSWSISLLYFFVCRMAVPLFVMIAGYTMLDRQDDYKKCIQRICRIIMVIVVFSSIYYINSYLKGTVSLLSIVEYIRALYNQPQTLAYWYLYMYIGLLIMLPFLQKMAANMKKIDCQIMIGISLVSYGCLPIIEYNWPEWTVSKIVDMSVFSSFVNMMFIGYYIKKYVKASKKGFVFSGIGYIVIIIFNILVTYYEHQKNGGVNYLFYQNIVLVTIILQTAFFFYMMKCIQWNEKLAICIKVIAGCTFGIYLLGDLIIEKTIYMYYYLNEIGIHPLISEVIWQMVVFGIGLLITLVLKRMPYIKRLL